MRLPASILAYTLGISLVVSILLSSIILLGYYHRLESKIYTLQLQLDRNLQSAEQLALAHPEVFRYHEPQSFDLFKEGGDTVVIEKKPWGFYDFFRIEARHGRFQKASYFSVGHAPAAEGQSGLYLIDERRPLSVVGDTRISGISYLPQSGVQSAYIDRRGYRNDSLFYGQRRPSEGKMPEVNVDLWESLEEISDYENQLLWTESSPLKQAFSSDTLVSIAARELVVTDTLQGFIYLQARRLIFDSLSHTQHIVARAQVIEFRNGYQGSGQFFASDTIYVHSGAILNYPSVVFLNSERKRGLIHVAEKARIEGTVGLEGDPDRYYQRVLYIEDEGEIAGMVYCHGFLEHYGTIHGHVIARKTLVNAPSSVYENYLLNATIDGSRRNPAFLMPPYWFYTKTQKVLAWLP